MKTKLIALFFIITVLFIACKKEVKHNNYPDGLYAQIETTKGTIVVELDYANAPITVANFVSLAEGKNTFVNDLYKGKPFYNGLKFHRVIPNFMIQGGDPDGTGSGGTGCNFKDEISDAKFTDGGILAMANSGPATNSSQFFITHLATPWLDGKHTIFGHVIEKGMEVVNKIVQDDVINSITIIRNGDAAIKFDAIKVFSDYYAVEAENKKKLDSKLSGLKAKMTAVFNQLKTTATKSTTGLQYVITQKGTAPKATNGSTVFIQYSGYLEDGTLFDSSVKQVEESYGKYNEQKDVQGGYKPFPFEIGKKTGLIPGFIEGLEKMNIGDKAVLFIPSNLGYGAQGAGALIPPNSNIIFEIEMLKSIPK